MCTRINAEIEALNVRSSRDAMAQTNAMIDPLPGRFLLDPSVSGTAGLPDRREAAKAAPSSGMGVSTDCGSVATCAGSSSASRNLNVSESRIRDLQAAAAILISIKAQILQQGCLAMLAQAGPELQPPASQPK